MRPGTAWAAALATLTLSCGGGTPPTGAGGHAGAAAGAGQGGGAALGGQGGSNGSGGSVGPGGAGDDLPACAIAQRPDDPANPEGGTPLDPTSGTCNGIQPDGQPVASEMLVAVGAGVREDGGAIEAPAGGPILDGDYDFVRWQALPGNSSIRKIRVFGGGTYLEWLVSNARGAGPDAGFASMWYDTTAAASGEALSLSFVCGDVLVTSYGYTARGDDLVLFDYGSAGPVAGTLFSVDTYRRTCTRP